MSEKLSTAELVAIALALEEDEKIQPKPTKRKYAAHPMNAERRYKGQFQNSYNELRKYPEKFFSFYRMSTQTFDEMLNLIKPNISKMENIKNDTISPEERLTITLKNIGAHRTHNEPLENRKLQSERITISTLRERLTVYAPLQGRLRAPGGRRWPHCWKLTARQGQPPLLGATESLLPVARAMCDRLAALDGLGIPPAAVTCRSTPSSPNAYRAVVQQQQLEKTASVPDLPQQKRHGGDERASEDDGLSVAATEQRAAPASACGTDSKSEGCLTESGRLPVTSLSGTFLTPVTKTDNKGFDGQKHQLNKLNDMTMATDYSRDMLQDELVLPRKPVNPCLTSADHQNLHRELLFNQKIGKNVLGQKSELQKALEKHKRVQTQKELEQQKQSCRTPFERMIEERAKKLETQMEKTDTKEKDEDKPEFLQVHAKLRSKMAKTD